MRKAPSKEATALLVSLGIPSHYWNVNRTVLAKTLAGMDHAAKRVTVFKLRQVRMITAIVAMEAAGVIA
jgi:hypothetical protein